MSTCELTVTVDLKRRSTFGIIRRVPALWLRHYRTLRATNGVIVSAYAAWLLASRVVVMTHGNGTVHESDMTPGDD